MADTETPPPPATTVTVMPPAKPELVTGAKAAPIIPRNIDEVARIANAVIAAGLAPDSYTKNTLDEKKIAAKIMVGIMKGAEIGLSPLTALANIAIINGRPCLWGDGAVALVQSSGQVEKWTEVYEGEGDNLVAVCSISRRGQSEPYVGRFSIRDATRAKLLTKGPWIEYRERMLMWRARGYAMRTGFADCLSGLAIAEEAQDIPAAPMPVNSAAFLEDDSPEAPPAATTTEEKTDEQGN